QVFGHLLLEQRPRGVLEAGLVAEMGDRLVDGCEAAALLLVVDRPPPDREERWVEQAEAGYAITAGGRELERDPAAQRGADEHRLVDPTGVHDLLQVVAMRLRRLVAGPRRA